MTRPVRDVARIALRRTCHRYPSWYNARDERLVRHQLLEREVHEPDLLGLALLLGPAPVVFDVGANYGQSIVSIKSMRPAARVVSFEPSASALPQLRRVAAAFDDVEVRPTGAGRTDERLELWVPVVRGVRFHQLASLEPLDAQDLVRQLHSDGFRWARSRDVRWQRSAIDVVPLDSVPLTPDLIKIDVEGAEPAVLDGAATKLRSRPILVIERGLREEVRHRLEPLGYEAMEWRGAGLRAATGSTLNTYFLFGGVAPAAA